MNVKWRKYANTYCQCLACWALVPEWQRQAVDSLSDLADEALQVGQEVDNQSFQLDWSRQEAVQVVTQVQGQVQVQRRVMAAEHLNPIDYDVVFSSLESQPSLCQTRTWQNCYDTEFVSTAGWHHPACEEKWKTTQHTYSQIMSVTIYESNSSWTTAALAVMINKNQLWITTTYIWSPSKQYYTMQYK